MPRTGLCSGCFGVPIRMSKIHDILVTLACGTVTRAVTPEELAAEVRLPSVRPALLALLLRPVDPQAVHSRQPSPLGEGGEGERSVGRNVERLDPSVGPDVSPKRISGANVAERPAAGQVMLLSEGIEVLAQEVAAALDDPTSVGWYRQAATELGSSVVRAILRQTLEVPAWKLRRSRAAYFTGICSRLIREARSRREPVLV